MADEKSAESTLYVTSLPSGFTEDQVKSVFAHYGAVSFVKVLAPRPGKEDGAAIVSMESADKAQWMVENVSGKIPQGMQTPVDIKPKRSNNWSKGGFGKGFGKGGYLPPWFMMQMMQWQWGKGKGFGKGKSRQGLRSFPPEKKVWVGGLPEDGSITFKELQEHFKSVGEAKFAAVMKGSGAGTGGVAFGTEEEAKEAIAKLNGSELAGNKLVVDVWEKKEKEEVAA
jgi:RNA recognition motif-containing protein